MAAPSYPLFTDRLALRPFRAGDLDALHSMQSRADVTRYLYWAPRSRAETEAVLERVVGMTWIDEASDAVRLAAILRHSGELIGDFSVRRTSREHRQGEIGFVLHPDHHGRGYGTEASLVMLRLGFEELGFHRIVGRCDARNAASARLMERLGMRREAHFRENELVKGEWTDELVFAMLAREWEARRQTSA
ncbi:MAG TPA: GNAT family protein [Candidatus Limnocylindria bacterium]|nr:GNAT family protein [Candidatus Limnocylindria bacterium]